MQDWIDEAKSMAIGQAGNQRLWAQREREKRESLAEGAGERAKASHCERVCSFVRGVAASVWVVLQLACCFPCVCVACF